MKDIIADLRERRLKLGVDYAILSKYGEVRVLCNRVFRESVKEVMDNYNVEVTEWYLYG
jgi:hypothetical protein